MKKLTILAACILVWACKKEGLTPEPLPEPIVETPVVDTSKHNIINDWTNYQYKYMYQGNTWISVTNWNVRLTKDTLKIDEGQDGDYEKKYPVTFQSTPQMSLVTVVYPGPTPKLYEIRATRVGKKQGYDLINQSEIDKDIYSFIK